MEVDYKNGYKFLFEFDHCEEIALNLNLLVFFQYFPKHLTTPCFISYIRRLAIFNYKIRKYLMKTSDFNFHLPEELLAEHPSENRDEARLMVLRP